MIHKILQITMIKKYREEALLKKKEANFLTIAKRKQSLALRCPRNHKKTYYRWWTKNLFKSARMSDQLTKEWELNRWQVSK